MVHSTAIGVSGVRVRLPFQVKNDDCGRFEEFRKNARSTLVVCTAYPGSVPLGIRKTRIWSAVVT